MTGNRSSREMIAQHWPLRRCGVRQAKIALTPNVAIAERKGTDESMTRSRLTFLSSLIFAVLAGMAGTLPVRGQEAKAGLSVTAKPGEWRYLNSDPMSTRYSPLDQIDKD